MFGALFGLVLSLFWIGSFIYVLTTLAALRRGQEDLAARLDEVLAALRDRGLR